MNSPLPTVLCMYCGKPTTYTGTKHCNPCHGAIGAPTETLFKILIENGYLVPLTISPNLYRKERLSNANS